MEATRGPAIPVPSQPHHYRLMGPFPAHLMANPWSIVREPGISTGKSSPPVRSLRFGVTT